MPEETATQLPTSEVPAPTAEPTTTEPAEPEVAPTATEETLEEAPADGEPAPLPEGWNEREEAIALKKEGHSEGWRQGFAKAAKAKDAEIASLSANSNVYHGLQDLIMAVEKVADKAGLLEDSDEAKRELTNLLSRNEALSKALTISEQTLRTEGQDKVLGAFLDITSSGLPKAHQPTMTTFRDRLIEDTKVGIAEPAAFWTTLLAKRDELVAKEAFDRGKAAGIDTKGKADGKSDAATTRTSLKGPEPKTGGAGGKTYASRNELDLALANKEITISQFKDLRRAFEPAVHRI